MEPAADLFKRPRSPVRRDRSSGAVPMLDLSDASTPAETSVGPLPLAVSPSTIPSPRRISKLEYSSRSGPDLGSPARMTLSKSDAGAAGPDASRIVARSPGKAKGTALMPVDRTKSIYSPRWIVSVKRETDKQVLEFLANLKHPDVQALASPSVLHALTSLGGSFLVTRLDNLGEMAKSTVTALRRLPTHNAKDKQLVVQLLLAISSCSRLDQYIESVREAEQLQSGAGSSARPVQSRQGYDGLVEYSTDSPRLRDSSKRASFMSQSLDADAFMVALGAITTHQSHPQLRSDGSDGVVAHAAATAAGTAGGGGGGSGGSGHDVANAIAGGSAGSAATDADPMTHKLCRVCEQNIERAIYDEHVRFCTTKTGYEIEVLNIDRGLRSLVSAAPAHPVRDVLEKAAGVTAGVGGFFACMTINRDLANFTQHSVPAVRDVAVRGRELIQRKIRALQTAEKVVLQSPRLPSPKNPSTPNMLRKVSTTAKIPTINDFDIVKPITRGGFGGVYLARKKATNDLYAIKALNRKEMIRRGEMKSILAERNILATLQSEHVVKLYFAMASRKYLFFVMEYMAGGDCFTLLRKYGRLDESVAKFYLAEVVLALEDIHRQGVVHRDLKPDNILIGADGHVKLADFGLSAVGLMNKQAREGDAVEEQPTEQFFKGTPQYLAPEILLGLPHGQAVDWWALGVMVFEFINGYKPFDGESPEDIFREVLSGNIRWPVPEHDEMSAHCKGLITRLLDNDPETRLASAVRVKAHPFFSDVDWLSISSDVPPMIPQDTLISEEDTSAFKEREEFFPLSSSIDDESISSDTYAAPDDSDGSTSEEDDDGDGDEGDGDGDGHKGKRNMSFSNFWHVSLANLAASGKHKDK